ncbi:MAG: InlB B-repeat-containing protein [Clostridia bacterium]|nr:InlB B-repeat-containing protein [Clostridia bacterium]
MTKTKKLFAALLAALMILAVLPVASFAAEAAYQANEAAGMKRWDDVWSVLDAVEAEMMEQGANRAEVVYAVYKAALNCPLIDKGSITDLNDNEFSFTTNGMVGGYNYRVRNFTKAPAKQTNQALETESVTAAAKVIATKGNCPTNGAVDVLLVGPYYSSDSSFTDQYKNEAASIAAATGGTVTQVINSNATGPNIAANYTNKAVVIYDSHGNCISSKQTSYLDLTSSTGLTTTDYNNGWAYNGGSFYGIDGRYIQNHVSGTITNTLVWMAICQGMMKEGKGTTGTALLAAGCAAVYGYSQSVSFTGDYKYEAKFWTEMKNGATVAEALQVMKNTYGVPDPVTGGDAYPILMSPVDAFPSNPDGAQTVYCDWTLFGDSEPEPITSVSLANVNVVTGGTATAQLTVAPTNADYTVQSYTSSNTAVATVTSAGVVTGVKAGTATLTAKVKDNTTSTVYTATATITVEDFEGYMLVDTIEDGGEYIVVAQGAISGTTGYAVGNYVVSGANKYLTPVAVTINSDDTCTVSTSNEAKVVWKAAGNATSGYSFYNEAAGVYMALNSSEVLVPATSGIIYWLYESNKALNNQVDSEGYYYMSYAAASSSNNYTRYTTSTSSDNPINLYKKITSSEPDPVYYTVTFKDWDGTTLKTEQVIEGGSATAPANPSRVGYTFTGWDVAFNNVTSDLTVTAQYTINTYTVTFKDWDGTTLKTQTVNYGGAATAPANPTRVGYTFTGWDKAFTNVTSNLTVTAQYTINTYTVTFKDWDGTVLKTQTVNYGGAATAPADPIREGYTFAGWDKAFNNVTSDLVVTATYTENEIGVSLLGDVNCDGKVDMGDISALSAYLMGKGELTAQGLANADASGNGTVDSSDLSAIFGIICG